MGLTGTHIAGDSGHVGDHNLIDTAINALNAVPQCFTFSIFGVLTTSTGAIRFYNPGSVALVISSVRASVGTAPTGATILVDVHKDGTTIFTTQSARPTIAISGFTDVSDTPAVTSWGAGEYLTIDVDQVGSTIAGSDLAVQVFAT